MKVTVVTLPETPREKRVVWQAAVEKCRKTGRHFKILHTAKSANGCYRRLHKFDDRCHDVTVRYFDRNGKPQGFTSV